MSPAWTSVEFLVVAGYLALTTALGVALWAQNRGGEDYFVAGRNIPWWASGISLYMGNFSAWMFTGGSGLIYRTSGYGLLYFLATGAVAYFLGSALSASRWRRARVISPVEYTRQRFGLGTQQVLGLVTAVVFLAAAGNQLRALATVVHSALGLPLEAAAVVIGAIVVLYTLVGGLWAVTVTDTIQCAVLFAITLVMAPLCLGLVEGGSREVLSCIDWSIPPVGGMPGEDLHFLLAGCISFTLGVASGAGPRFYCVPDEQAARKAGRLAAALFLSTPLLFSIPALVARTLYSPDQLAARILGESPHEQVFVFLAREVLPRGLVGVFLAAMFAATMSALDSVYHQVASVLSRDVYMLFRPATSDRALMWVGRVMTLLAGTLTVVICRIYMQGRADLFTVMTEIFYLAAPITAAPLLMGLFLRRASRGAALASMFVGITTGLVTGKILDLGTGLQTYLTQSLCLGLFLVSPWLARLGRAAGRDRALLHATGVIFAAALAGILYSSTRAASRTTLHFASFEWSLPFSTWEVILGYSCLMGGSLILIAGRFARERPAAGVAEFYARLDRPVEPREIPGSTAAAASTYRIVGRSLLGMALFLPVLGFLDPDPARPALYAGLIGTLAGLGGLAVTLARRMDAPPGS